MIILKMRASFGKLNGELELHEGMNLLCLPNESGKSTWSAFLVAMLYGIDSHEQAKKANAGLPEKERYKPWDGRPMEGTMDLLWQGRRITLERSTKGRVPMGVFRAYDTDSGTPIPELTADNCGRMLCGVERSVFERSAFIRQLGLAVTEDGALEKRLNALVTTGEEGRSASELLQKLHEMDVKLSRASSGRIYRLRAEIEQTEREIDALGKMKDEAMSLRAQVEQTQQILDDYNTQLFRIDQAKNARKFLALEELKQKNSAQELLCRRLQEQTDALPSEEALHELQKQLEHASSELQTAQMEAAFAPPAPQKPMPPPCFGGLELDEVKRNCASDCAEYERLSATVPPKKTAILLSALVFLLGAAVCFFSLYLGLAIAALGLIAFVSFLVIYLRKTSEVKENRHRAEVLLSRYGVSDVSAIGALLTDYETAEERYGQEYASYEQEAKERTCRLSSAQERLDALIGKVRLFAPNCTDVSKCKEAVASALSLRMQSLSEQRTLELQRTQLASMHQLLGEAPSHEADTQALQLDEAKIIYERNAAAQKLATLQAKLAEQNGKISATGDMTALQNRLEQQQAQLASAQELHAVILHATAAMKQADETLRSRFSPQITAEAGAILSQLTDGKYPNVLLQPDMRLSVREEDGMLMRPAAAMSCGTADQMYLALRLAMVRRLLPENAPLLLDDALVNFDDVRTAKAIEVLSQEARHRQIILFTCKEISNVL